MKEIGLSLKEARVKAGISLEEASNDLKISYDSLKLIEEGNIGYFKDFYHLKYIIKDYSKYLGLNQEIIIDNLNEYLFDMTSKIPVEKIDKANKVKSSEKKVVSPYTNINTKNNKYIYISIIFIILVIIISMFVFFLNINSITSYI